MPLEVGGNIIQEIRIVYLGIKAAYLQYWSAAVANLD